MINIEPGIIVVDWITVIPVNTSMINIEPGIIVVNKA